MTTLEKILQDIEECRIIASLDGNFNSSASFKKCEEIIKKHLSCGNQTETTRQSRDNGWVACRERLPEEPPEYVDDEDELEEYIVMIEGAERPTTLRYSGDGTWWEDGIYYSVVAWQHFPEPYKPPVESAEEKSMREREEFFKDSE